MHDQIIDTNIININSKILVTFSINSILLQAPPFSAHNQFWVHVFETNPLLIC